MRLFVRRPLSGRIYMKLPLRFIFGYVIFFGTFSSSVWTHPLKEAIAEQDAIKFQHALINLDGVHPKQLLVYAARKYDPQNLVTKRMFEILFTHYRLYVGPKTKKILKKKAPKEIIKVIRRRSKSSVGSSIILRGSSIVPSNEHYEALTAAVVEYDTDVIFSTSKSQIRALAHQQGEEYQKLLDLALQSKQLDVIKLFADVKVKPTVKSPEHKRLLKLSRLSGNYFEQAQLSLIFDNLIESLNKHTNNELFWRQDFTAVKALTRFWTHASSLEHLRNGLAKIGKRKLEACDQAKLEDPFEIQICEQAMLKMLNDIHKVFTQPKSTSLDPDTRFFLILYSAIKTQYATRAPSCTQSLFMNTLLQRFVFSLIRGTDSKDFNPVLRNLQNLLKIVPQKSGASNNTFSRKFHQDARNKLDDIYQACRALESRPPLVSRTRSVEEKN